jgi:agmatine/peptidylarginine deiminase
MISRQRSSLATSHKSDDGRAFKIIDVPSIKHVNNEETDRLVLRFVDTMIIILSVSQII